MTDSLLIEQAQKAGNNSQNFQAGQVIVQQGLQYSEVKEIALDVFNANFFQLSDQAASIARKRAEEITDQFLKTLRERHPSGLQQAENPDFQMSLFVVQKEYARTGDKELGKLLVDLLVKRTKETQRTTLQIVLDESLSVASKLTTEQLSALALIYLLNYTSISKDGVEELSFESNDFFFKTLQQLTNPFIPFLTKKDTCYRHLEFTGCGGTDRIVSVDLVKVFHNGYRGMFTKGFTLDFITLAVPEMVGTNLIVECINENDPTKLQFNAQNEKMFIQAATKLGLKEDAINKAIKVWEGKLFSPEETRQKILTGIPQMELVFDVWNNSLMKNLNLTTVGIAIGCAYLQAKCDIIPDLSIWIN